MSVTLKDVAEKLGVTITTVHKALNGKEGVSEKRRAEIMKVAAQMGYKVNYMASSLSKKKFHIAVVLPNTDGDNRFYYGALWDGIRNYLDTVSEFPITVSEYAYPLTRDGNGLVLEKIFNQDSDDLQGLITIAMDHDRSSYFLEKFAKKQIPVVLIGADLHTDFRLCCIKANDTAVGYLAAELLTAFLPSGYPQRSLWPETMAALAWRISALICRHFQLTCIPMRHLLKQSRSRVLIPLLSAKRSGSI